MGFIVTNMFMMAFTSYFFEGFVLVRVPFPLTNRFKVRKPGDWGVTVAWSLPP